MNAPPFRIDRVVLENFRAFRGRHEIPLKDPIVVFHGENGSGKSTVLEAIDFFFQAANLCLEERAAPSGRMIGWGAKYPPSDFTVSAQLDYPPGVRDAIAVEVWFAGQQARNLNAYRVTVGQSGHGAVVTLQQNANDNVAATSWRRIEEGQVDGLRTQLLTPSAADSPAFAILDTRRDLRGLFIPKPPAPEAGRESNFSRQLRQRISSLTGSLEPRDKARWRTFGKLVRRFEPLKSRLVESLPQQYDFDLRFEEEDRLVLPFSRLSSGEQQIVLLCAAVLTARAPIVAIQEPELSLHPRSQELLRTVFGELVRDGAVDQLILESHVPVFDGEEVVRFTRNADGSCEVKRAPGQNHERRSKLKEQAADLPADEHWVTREGYTKLPKPMVEDLGFSAQGGNAWFVRTKGGHWEAWTEDELNDYLNPVKRGE